MDETAFLISSSEALPRSIIGNSFEKIFLRHKENTLSKSARYIPGADADTSVQISVVIATYRRASLLKNCLAALLNQTFEKNFYEIIVVSDGPDEAAFKLIKSLNSYHPRIHYLCLPEKKGPAAARNLGWQKAAGKLIAFTDDDCLPDRNWLSVLYGAYHEEEEIAFSGKIKVPLPPCPTDYEKNTSNLETAEFVTANCCCTRAALEKVEGFDERFSMAWREDSDLEFKLLQQHIPIVKIQAALVVHPVRKANWGISIKEQKKGIFNALLYKKFPALYRKKFRGSSSWRYYSIAAAFCCFVICIVLGVRSLALAAAFTWIFLTIRFIVLRLKSTVKTLSHISEMIVTSIAIPFISIYWRLYGSFKYRVLFL
jgi:glycosyltransferase involved in cell wall biosynthesis